MKNIEEEFHDKYGIYFMNQTGYTRTLSFLKNTIRNRDNEWVAKIALFLQQEAPELHGKFIDYLKENEKQTNGK